MAHHCLVGVPQAGLAPASPQYTMATGLAPVNATCEVSPIGAAAARMGYLGLCLDAKGA